VNTQKFANFFLNLKKNSLFSKNIILQKKKGIQDNEEDLQRTRKNDKDLQDSFSSINYSIY